MFLRLSVIGSDLSGDMSAPRHFGNVYTGACNPYSSHVIPWRKLEVPPSQGKKLSLRDLVSETRGTGKANLGCHLDYMGHQLQPKGFLLIGSFEVGKPTLYLGHMGGLPLSKWGWRG